MAQEKKYFAFISYKREDEKWAKWLQHRLEHYHLPTNVRKNNPSLPQHIRPVFKDTSELAAGVLADEIYDALDNSKYLIVICSPRAAQSKWVGKEVQTFIDMGRSGKIIPFIIGGKPFSESQEEECFPTALLGLPKEQELLGVNVNEMGREAAVVKVVARMFDLKFDTLWQRFEREKKRKRRLWTFVGVLSVITSFIIIAIIAGTNRKLKYQNNVIEREREISDSLKDVALRTNDSLQIAFANIKSQKDSILKQNQIIYKQKNDLNQTNKELHLSNIKLAQERDNVLRTNWLLMGNQSKAAAGKANELIEDGNPLLAERMMMNYLPDLKSNFVWPYVPEVEQAYRKSLATLHSAEWHQDTYVEHKLKVNTAIFDSKGSKILSASNDNTAFLWDIETGDTLTLRHDRLVNCATISNNGKYIATGCRDKVARIWDAKTGLLVDSWEPGGNVWEIMFTKNNKYVLTRSSNRALSFYDVESKKEIGRFPYRQQLSPSVFDAEGESFLYSFMDSMLTSVRIPLLINKFKTIEKIAANEDLEGFKALLSQMRPNGIMPIIYPHPYNVQTVKFNSKNETACLLCSDSIAIYGNLATGDIIDTIPNVIDCSFSPNGKILALAKSDGKVLIITSNEDIYDYDENSIDINDVCYQINFSNDGKYLIGTSSDKIVYIWNASSNYAEEAKLQHKLPIFYSFMNNDGNNILTVTADNRINLWGHSVGYNKTSLALKDSYANAIIFNKEETCFYVASYDGHISCYDVTSGKQMWSMATYTKSYKNLRNNCVAINENGTILAVGNESGEILIVNAVSGTLQHRYQIHTEDINSIYFVDDNNVITASHDGKVTISSIIKGNAIATYEHDNRVLYANIVKGGQQIISATIGGIFIWQTKSKSKKFFPIVHDNIESVAYNAHTNKIAIGTSNNTIHIKTIDNIDNSGLTFQHGQSPKGELFLFDSYHVIEHDTEFIEKIKGSMEGQNLGASMYDILSHKGRVDALQFSCDGKYLISKCKGSIKIWETSTGVCINDEIRVGIGFNCFAMSPQETFIATSSMDVKNIIPNKENELIDYLFLWKFDSLNKSLWNEKERLPYWRLSREEKQKYYLE